MYLFVSNHAVSAVLLRDRGVQQPVYYISKTLVDAETRYLPLEKLVLALVHATRKLPQYFQAYTVYVLTEYPLQSLLKRSDFTGRIAKWGTRLGAFDVRYKPRSSVKGQVLADFVAEFSPKGETVCQLEHRPWKVHVDGASNAKGAEAEIVIITLEGILLEHLFRLGFNASNNEAEYEVLLAGLRAVSRLEARDVEVYLDSRLIVNQVQGSFEARDPQMKACLELVKQAIGNFCTVKVIQVAELHVGGRLLAHRAMTQGFWWPQMQKDAMEYVRKCKRYQKHAPLIHQPTENLNPISSPWPFAQ